MDVTPVSVLIIDHDAASRNYLSAMLTKEGYQVLAASLGREGLISAWKDLPGVIIFDPDLPDLSGLDLITRLRQDRRTANVLCLALSSRDDPQVMSALLTAGCNEFMLKSGDALSNLIKFLPALTSEKKKTKKNGKLITFLSAKGGMGTSSLCANLAMCTAHTLEDKRVAVFDLVLPIGSIANIIGFDDRVNLISTALQPPETVDAAYFTENLPRVSGWYFNFLAGSQDPASAKQLAVERIPGIMSALLESHDYLFVDIGRSLSRISLPIIQQSNALVLTMGPSLTACSLTRMMFEYLKTLGVDPARFYAIQNRSVGLEGLSRTEAETHIGVPIKLTLPYLGENMTIANNQHQPFVSKFPEDSTSMVFQQIASEIVELSEKTVR
jgi:pilus assembly protein CpaE